MDLYRFDKLYLNRLRSADPETAEHFSAYFGQMLTLKLRNRLRSAEAVKDVKQETLLRVLKALDTVREPEKLGSFVNSTCNYVLFEYFRVGKRETPLEEAKHEAPDHNTDLEGGVAASETKANIRRALEKLDRKDRDLLTALFIDETDKDKICSKFGVDRAYLRVLLYRAKAQFRSVYRQSAGSAQE